MNIILLISLIVTVVLAATNLFYEYARDVMMLQQNSYRSNRYMRWLRTSGDTTSYVRLIALVVLMAALAMPSRMGWGLILIFLFSVGSASSLARKKYKKPLVWTPRVKRLFGCIVVISIVLTLGVWFLGRWIGQDNSESIYNMLLMLTGLFCASHIVVLLSLWVMQPVENSISRGYYNEARNIISSMPMLKVVGVTGSYGKTSTKHYLQRILSEKYETLMTPGSYNTTLGVVRTIREMMKPYCEVFICEMGAKQRGDIREICDLVCPQIGVVTSVGPQHLESFKTIENVRDTKFELVDCLPSDGLAVVNDDFEMSAGRDVANVDCVRYAVENTDNAQYVAEDIKYTPQGTEFTLLGPDFSQKFTTKLVGECNVSNLIAAIVVALKLNVEVEKIQRAVKRIEPVEHRLSMKTTPGGITIIDDAFNSNPVGSKMALDVLASFKDAANRIVITPGMIELGSEQYELNRKFGEKIAHSASVAIVVGKYNRDAIVEGLKSVDGAEVKIIEVDSFNQAQQELMHLAVKGDVVLYENDLPDTFK